MAKPWFYILLKRLLYTTLCSKWSRIYTPWWKTILNIQYSVWKHISATVTKKVTNNAIILLHVNTTVSISVNVVSVSMKRNTKLARKINAVTMVQLYINQNIKLNQILYYRMIQNWIYLKNHNAFCKHYIMFIHLASHAWWYTRMWNPQHTWTHKHNLCLTVS